MGKIIKIGTVDGRFSPTKDLFAIEKSNGEHLPLVFNEYYLVEHSETPYIFQIVGIYQSSTGNYSLRIKNLIGRNGKHLNKVNAFTANLESNVYDIMVHTNMNSLMDIMLFKTDKLKNG